MARTLFSVDALLDAAREVVLQRGPRGATITTIAARAGAPVGSIYHRFDSVDELLAQVWLRAVRRTHTVWPQTLPSDPPAMDVIVELALALFDHCVADPHDALLLDRMPREDVMNLRLPAETLDQIRDAEQTTNYVMVELAKALLGRTRRDDLDLLVLAIVDMPFSFAKRYLQQGQRPPRARRSHLPDAVRAIIGSNALPQPAVIVPPPLNSPERRSPSTADAQ
ncbi:TetR/AcrR family transcriptional regulator [Nocardia sienata]|uniref:TetR/AcrR family transcriptional regulator n=1 Tax=Nocardia sienata TaxID=248552 RepID=UPI0007A3723E|nr:TetR/AcrR family transcriptional regulator [Nocardia sienata]